jgi:hypothetical protein
MSLELKDVAFQDGASIADVYVRAFLDDNFQRSLYPGMSFEKQLAGVISRWPQNYGSLSSLYKKVEDVETGITVSYSKWSLANTASIRQLRQISGMLYNQLDISMLP